MHHISAFLVYGWIVSIYIKFLAPFVHQMTANDLSLSFSCRMQLLCVSCWGNFWICTPGSCEVGYAGHNAPILCRLTKPPAAILAGIHHGIRCCRRLNFCVDTRTSTLLNINVCCWLLVANAKNLVQLVWPVRKTPSTPSLVCHEPVYQDE